jgi:general secretion pathway protein H
MSAAPPAAAAGRERGFTLLEILVVVVILVIVLGMVGLRLGGDTARELRTESERLALLMQAAQQEAILSGHDYAVRLYEDGYEFLVRNAQGKFEEVADDDTLRPRDLSEKMVRVRSLSLDGAPVKLNHRILLSSTGELPQAFVVTLEREADEARWRVEGGLNGVIRPMPPET